MRRYALGVSALLLAACSAGQHPAASRPPESPARPGAVPSSGAPISSPPGDAAEVVHIYDGDSLVAKVGGNEVEIRLIGINAPEGTDCHGEAARESLTRALASGEPTLVTDSEEADQFGRALRYLYVDGINVNLALVASGDAVALQTGHLDEDEFTRASDAAYTSRLGMWAADACGSPTAPPEVAIVDYRYNPSGRDEEAMNEEWVAIANPGPDDLDLAGWTLRDESTQNRFEFPVGFVLPASAEVLVRSGCGDDTTTDLYWCADYPVWSNGGDTIILQTPDGTVAARYRFPGDF